MSILLEQPDPGRQQDLADLRAIYDADPGALRQLPAAASLEQALVSDTVAVHAIRFNSRLIAAACCWRPAPDILRIGALAVRPSSRDRGLPERLVHGLAKQLDASTRWLEVLLPATPEDGFEPAPAGFLADAQPATVMLRFRRPS